MVSPVSFLVMAFGLSQAFYVEPLDMTNNTELFDPSTLIPLKRSISVDVLKNITYNTELFSPEDVTPLKRSVNVAENRATTDCGCGYANKLGRIVGGQEVNPQHSRPYQLYLQACSNRGCAMCGATLINKRYALTAMHCVEGSNNFNVALGEHNIKEDIENHKVKTIKVERVIERADYNTQRIDNDIAILKLSEDVTFNDNVVPACLPTNPNKKYANMNAVVSGWGTTTEGGSTSDVLKETTVKILADSDPICTTGANENPLPASKMCAYKQGTDSCQGDSGGPLVVKEDGRFTVVGVVSYGMGCARDGNAGVYARVTNYLEWINENVQDGWCNTQTPPQTPAPVAAPVAAPVSAPTPSTTNGPICDLSCISQIGSLSADLKINRIPARCDQGQCYAKDGQDFCKMFNSPCAFSCSNPCNLSNYLRQIQTTDNVVKLILGPYGPITCKMSTGNCCADDGSDLCAKLGFLAGFLG